MALQTRGSISLLDIAAEFDPDYDDNLPYALTDFYSGGAYVPAGATNGAGDAIPASGRISLTDFYGAPGAAAILVTITGSRAALDADARRTFGSTVGSGGSGAATRRWLVSGDASIIGSSTGASVVVEADSVGSAGGFDLSLSVSRGSPVTHRGSASTGEIAVNPTLTVSVTVNDDTPTNGDTVTFTATLGGSAAKAATYQWQHVVAGSWRDISGETGNTYDHTRNSAGSITVRCRVAGAGISRVSGPVLATWSTGVPPDAEAPRLSIALINTVNEGAAAFDVHVSPSGGLYDTIDYRWRAALGTISGSGPTARYTPPANDGVPGDRTETIDVAADVGGTGRRAKTGTTDSTNSVENDRARFAIANVPITQTRARAETRYRRATAKPDIAQARSPAGWTTARPASGGQSVWQANGTINESRTDGGPWNFVSASWVVLDSPAIHVRAAYPGPLVSVEAFGTSIVIDVSPPSSGWRGEHGASISGTWLRGFTLGLINNLGTRSQPAQVPFANGFVGGFGPGEYVEGDSVSATVWAVYSDGGVSAEVSDFDTPTEGEIP